jgi:PHD/YefM family antitoxin component YafN of YafNO toxin-antitoxin module
MASKSTRVKKRTEPEIVLRGGKPAAVILDIEHYLELVERAEDAEELKMLEAMRRKPIRFRKLDDFLKSYAPDA